MQMLTIKPIMHIILSFIILMMTASLCSANIRFVEQFQAEPLISPDIADRITQYHSENISLTLEQQKTELLQLDKQLITLKNKYKNQAIYWFIRGLNDKNIASLYDETGNVEKVKVYIDHKNTAYKTALKLNKSGKNTLSAAIFSTMKPGLSEDLKITATKNEIALGGNGDNDSYYWYLHWSNIDQLEKAGRKDEAKSAYKQMQKELKNSGMDMSVYSSLTKKIESETLKQTKNQKKTSSKKNKPQPEKNTPRKKYDTKIIVISSIAVFSALSLIGVIIYEIKRKKKRKKKH